MRIDITFNKLPCEGMDCVMQLWESSLGMNWNIWKAILNRLFRCSESQKMEISRRNTKEVRIDRFRRNC